MKRSIFVFFLLIGSITYAQYGTPDFSFGTGGHSIISVVPGEDNVQNILLQPDGKILLAGITDSASQDYFLARYLSNGLPDSSFNHDGKVIFDVGGANNYFVGAMAMQPDGKILLAGDVLARFNSNGSLDTSFASNGVNDVMDTSFNFFAYSMALQSDGKIILGGYKNYAPDAALARFNSNGSIDSSFNGVGYYITVPLTYVDMYDQLLIQPDGKIIASGEFYTTGPVVHRFQLNGTMDATYNSNFTTVSTFKPTELCLLPDGKILAVGKAYSGPIYKGFITKIDTNGQIDTAFGMNGSVIENGTGCFNDVVVQADGKIIAIGNSGGNFLIARYFGNGAIDSSFGTYGLILANFGYTDEAMACAVQADGKLVVTGNRQYASSDMVLARYHSITTSVYEVYESVAFSVYPNPVSDQLTISSKTTFNNASLKLLDVSGQVVLTQQNISGNNFTLDVSSQTAGLYIVEIDEKGSVSRVKLIKN